MDLDGFLWSSESCVKPACERRFTQRQYDITVQEVDIVDVAVERALGMKTQRENKPVIGAFKHDGEYKTTESMRVWKPTVVVLTLHNLYRCSLCFMYTKA